MIEEPVKKGRGCLFIVIIIISSFAGIGIFIVIGDYLVGPDNRHLIFFAILGFAGIFFLVMDLLKKD